MNKNIACLLADSFHASSLLTDVLIKTIVSKKERHYTDLSRVNVFHLWTSYDIRHLETEEKEST